MPAIPGLIILVPFLSIELKKTSFVLSGLALDALEPAAIPPGREPCTDSIMKAILQPRCLQILVLLGVLFAATAGYADTDVWTGAVNGNWDTTTTN